MALKGGIFFAPPCTGELSAKLTEGANLACSTPSVRRFAPDTSPASGAGKPTRRETAP